MKIVINYSDCNLHIKISSAIAIWRIEIYISLFIIFIFCYYDDLIYFFNTMSHFFPVYSSLLLHLHQFFIIISSRSAIYFCTSFSAFLDQLSFTSFQSIILPSRSSFHSYLILLTSLFSYSSFHLFSKMDCYMILHIILPNFYGFWPT